MPDQPDRPTKDHPDVRVPPPLLYFSVLGIGLLLQQAAPLPVIPPSAGHPLAIAAATGWAGLMIWGVSSFRRARTSLVPVRPATALITDGLHQYVYVQSTPGRFARREIQDGAEILHAGGRRFVEVDVFASLQRRLRSCCEFGDKRFDCNHLDGRVLENLAAGQQRQERQREAEERGVQCANGARRRFWNRRRLQCRNRRESGLSSSR